MRTEHTPTPLDVRRAYVAAVAVLAMLLVAAIGGCGAMFTSGLLVGAALVVLGSLR